MEELKELNALDLNDIIVGRAKDDSVSVQEEKYFDGSDDERAVTMTPKIKL